MPKICLTIKLRRSQLCDKTLYTYVYGICGRTLYGNAGIMLSILEIKIFINKLLIIIEIISSFLHRCQWKNKVLQRIFTSLSSTCTGKNKENDSMPLRKLIPTIRATFLECWNSYWFVINPRFFYWKPAKIVGLGKFINNRNCVSNNVIIMF